jgi:hypothetical protein
MTGYDTGQQRGDERGREVPDMNEDSPNGSLYGTLAKHDQSEMKRDTSSSGIPTAPAPFPPYGGINAVQPWTYTQYTPQQLAELSHRFPVHPLAIEHATVGGGDSLTHEARGRVANGPVDQDLHAHKDARVGAGGTKANVAAPEDAQEGRFYPNEVVGPGGKFHSHLCAVKLLADCLNLKCGSSRLT